MRITRNDFQFLFAKLRWGLRAYVSAHMIKLLFDSSSHRSVGGNFVREADR